MPKNPLPIGKVQDYSGSVMSYMIVTAGTFTTAGGDATETITDSLIEAGDLAFVQLETEGSTPVTVDAAAVSAGTITVTMSADPSTDHVLAYQVIRLIDQG